MGGSDNGGADFEGSELNEKRLEFDMLRRYVSHMLGVPHICRVRRCRRSGRCLGPSAVCYYDHAGVLRRRFERILDLAAAPFVDFDAFTDDDGE